MQRDPASDDDFGTAEDMSPDESPQTTPHYPLALRPRGRAPSPTPVNKPRVTSSSPQRIKTKLLSDIKKNFKGKWESKEEKFHQ